MFLEVYKDSKKVTFIKLDSIDSLEVAYDNNGNIRYSIVTLGGQKRYLNKAATIIVLNYINSNLSSNGKS